MKAIKIYLIVVSILLFFAIGAGVYVWYVVQNLDAEVRGTSGEQKIETRPAEMIGEVKSENTSASTPPPVVIQTSNLPEAQKKMLGTVGIDGDTITITSSMIICAEKAVGKERLAEIQKGTAPTAFESVKLLPCLKP